MPIKKEIFYLVKDGEDLFPNCFMLGKVENQGTTKYGIRPRFLL